MGEENSMHKTFKMKSQFVKDYIENQNHEYYIKEDNNLVPYDFIISKLDSDSQRIIYSDYVVIQPKNWYLSFYSKSTYYRLKNIALDDFIKLSKSL